MFDTLDNGKTISNLGQGNRASLGRKTYMFVCPTLASSEFSTLENAKLKASWTAKKTAVRDSRCYPFQIEDYEIVTDSTLVTQEKEFSSGTIPINRKGAAFGLRAFNVLPEELKRLQSLNGKSAFVYFGYATGVIDCNSIDGVKVHGKEVQFIVNEKQMTGTTAEVVLITATMLDPQTDIDKGELIDTEGTDIILSEIGTPIISMYFEKVSAEAGEIVFKAIDSKRNPVAGLVTADVKVIVDDSTQAVIAGTLSADSVVTNKYRFTATTPADIAVGDSYTVESKGVATQTLKTHETENALYVTV